MVVEARPSIVKRAAGGKLWCMRGNLANFDSHVSYAQGGDRVQHEKPSSKGSLDRAVPE